MDLGVDGNCVLATEANKGLECALARLGKRSFDLVAAAAGLVLLFPLFLVVAIAVKFASPGPVFYRGWRTGLHGRQFRIYKFRTMVVNAERVGDVHTAKNDPRITRGGHLLRKYKLDELPQLINVLKGDMSFVGPRPEVAEYTDRYQGEERLILAVRPGITDYSSIAFVSLGDVLGDDDPRTVFESVVLPRKNALRIKYVKDSSLRLDLKIIIGTFAVILRKLRASHTVSDEPWPVVDEQDHDKISG